MNSQEDLAIIEQMKQLIMGLSKLCSRSEKSFKIVLSDRMLESAFAALELIMSAHEINIGRSTSRSDMNVRLEYQRQAYQKLKTLETYMSLGPSIDGLMYEQFEAITKMLATVTTNVQIWCRNDIERIRKAGVDIVSYQTEEPQPS